MSEYGPNDEPLDSARGSVNSMDRAWTTPTDPGSPGKDAGTVG